MINLISTEEKKRKNTIFYFKLLVVVLWVLGFSILIFAIASVPSYFVSSVNKNLIDEKLKAQKNEILLALDQEALSTLKDLNKKLSLIENAQKNNFSVSKNVISEIISQKMANIKITQISYENDPIKGKFVNIEGLAPNRDQLLVFRKALEYDPFFSKVDLPISNFVKGSNIQFYLNLIPCSSDDLVGHND